MDPALVKQLNADDADQKILAIKQLALTADADTTRVLQALSDDALLSDGDKILRSDGEHIYDALSGQEISPLPDTAVPIVINNRVRREIATTLAALKLFVPSRDQRLAAAKELEDNVDPFYIPILDRALAQEKDPEIKAFVAQARALIALKSPDALTRLAAVKTLGESNSPSLKVRLIALTDPTKEADEHVRLEAKNSLRALNTRLALGENIERIFSGLSLGSVLLLAALGLAITYGVMGVINMAHGELLMVGAYATYGAQNDEPH